MGPPTPRMDGFELSMFWIPEELLGISAPRDNILTGGGRFFDVLIVHNFLQFVAWP
jgi:hypothetical protein